MKEITQREITQREILVQLDYYEIVRKIQSRKKKKVIGKSDPLYVNVVPYIEFPNKYEVEKQGNNKVFSKF